MLWYLQEATLPANAAGRVPEPGNAADVLAALDTGLSVFPAVLRQLADRQRAFAADPALADVASGHPGGAAGVATMSADDLQTAATAAERAAQAIAAAHLLSTRLYRRDGDGA